MDEIVRQIPLDEVIAALRRDYSALAVRIRALNQSVEFEFRGLTLRLHFPAYHPARQRHSPRIGRCHLRLHDPVRASPERYQPFE